MSLAESSLRHPRHVIAVCALLATLALPVVAQTTASSAPDASQRHARSLAATCAACHGTDGRALPNSGMPPLAGIPKEKLIERMRQFQGRERAATVMRQISSGYSAAQVEAIASYFAARQKESAQ